MHESYVWRAQHSTASVQRVSAIPSPFFRTSESDCTEQRPSTLDYRLLAMLKSKWQLILVQICWSYCRLKAYIVFTVFDSFRNKSGKPQPIRTKIGTHAQVKDRQRSRNFGRDGLNGGEMGGAKVSPTPGVFVSNTRWLFGNFATADFRQIWPWHVNRG